MSLLQVDDGGDQGHVPAVNSGRQGRRPTVS
jgi:hypothetical protein